MRRQRKVKILATLGPGSGTKEMIGKLFAAGAERGVDLADGLRALSEDLRDSRREEIRQTATKRRAAMLVPTIAVLAPVMLLFIAAPLPSIVFGSR